MAGLNPGVDPHRVVSRVAGVGVGVGAEPGGGRAEDALRCHPATAGAGSEISFVLSC